MNDKYGIEVYVKLVADQAISGAKALAKGLKNTLGGENPMEKAVKTSKRLALSLFGVTTIWRGIIKSVNTYLSVNTELQARLNGMYYALGSLFAPVLEWILNILGTWVLYIDAFARGLGLAGIQMNNLNKQAKKTSHSLAGFDEINNLTEKSSGGGGSITNPFEGIVLGDFADKLYVAGEWIKNNFPTFISLITALGTAFLILKRDYGTFKDNFGITLILTGVIGLIQSLISFIKDPSWEHFGEILVSIGVILAGLAVTLGILNNSWLGLFGVVIAGVGLIIANWQKFSDFFSALGTNLKKAWTDATDNLKETWNNAWSNLHKKASEWGKKIGDAVISVFTPIEYGFKTFINDNIIESINWVIRKINSVFGSSLPQMSKMTTTVYKKASSIAIGGLSSYDVGTNYVPNDQLAYIHQGEAIIPKKFNSSEYFNSDETNSLLQELIERVDAIELNPYVTVKDVGQASVKYINQQARIKGGSVL